MQDTLPSPKKNRRALFWIVTILGSKFPKTRRCALYSIIELIILLNSLVYTARGKQPQDLAVKLLLCKIKGCFDSIWLPQFPTSLTSLYTVESHCLLYIPNDQIIRTLVNIMESRITVFCSACTETSVEFGRYSKFHYGKRVGDEQ